MHATGRGRAPGGVTTAVGGWGSRPSFQIRFQLHGIATGIAPLPEH
jgi:hypothetical protein